MSSVIKNVIIIGAGGNLGPAILEALDKDPQFIVSVLSRKSSNSTFPAHIKVHSIDDSYPENELVEAFRGQDAVVTTIAIMGSAKQIEIVKAAVAAGVKRFIPAEFGSDNRDPKWLELMPVFHVKNQVVDFLRSQESTGMSWTGVITSAFFDWGLTTKQFLGFNLDSCTALIYDSGDARFSATTLPTIGAAIVAILHKPEETTNQYIYIASFTTTQNEVLAALEKATGKKWQVEHSTAMETRRIGQEKVGKGDFSGMENIVVSLVYGGDSVSDLESSRKLANDLLGLPKETVEETVEKIVKSYSIGSK